jgi:HPt (histidine-containing phosphotransfer) domain-containing protein
MGIESELIDWEQLDMMADGYTPDFVEIYREFLDQTPELLKVLERHLLEGDAAAVRDAAHKIKGSSANFGFVGVSGPMSRLELQAKETGDLEGAVERMLEARGNFEKSRIEVHEKRGI